MNVHVKLACSRRAVSKQRRDSTGRVTGNKARKKGLGYGRVAPNPPLYFSSVHYRRSIGAIAPLFKDVVGGGGPGVPVTPLCKPFFKETTYNIP